MEKLSPQTAPSTKSKYGNTLLNSLTSKYDILTIIDNPGILKNILKLDDI